MTTALEQLRWWTVEVGQSFEVANNQFVYSARAVHQLGPVHSWPFYTCVRDKLLWHSSASRLVMRKLGEYDKVGTFKKLCLGWSCTSHSMWTVVVGDWLCMKSNL